MSHVTDIILVFDTDAREPEDVLESVNAFFEGRGKLAHLTPKMGGTKHPQLEVAGGSFNYLDIEGFLDHLRSVDWGGGFSWASVAIQDEHDQGAGWIEVYRGPDADMVGAPFAVGERRKG